MLQDKLLRISQMLSFQCVIDEVARKRAINGRERKVEGEDKESSPSATLYCTSTA